MIRVRTGIVFPPLRAAPVRSFDGLEVQPIVAPLVVLVKDTNSVLLPEQIDWLFRLKTTTGDGFTVILKVSDGPSHEIPPLLKVGVTVIIDVTGDVVLLLALNEISPFPGATNPMSLLSFDHK